MFRTSALSTVLIFSALISIPEQALAEVSFRAAKAWFARSVMGQSHRALAPSKNGLAAVAQAARRPPRTLELDRYTAASLDRGKVSAKILPGRLLDAISHSASRNGPARVTATSRAGKAVAKVLTSLERDVDATAKAGKLPLKSFQRTVVFARNLLATKGVSFDAALSSQIKTVLGNVASVAQADVTRQARINDKIVRETNPRTAKQNLYWTRAMLNPNAGSDWGSAYASAAREKQTAQKNLQSLGNGARIVGDYAKGLVWVDQLLGTRTAPKRSRIEGWIKSGQTNAGVLRVSAAAISNDALAAYGTISRRGGGSAQGAATARAALDL